MKKVICGILSIVILSSSLLLPTTTFAADEDNNSGFVTKEEVLQRLHDKYGDDPFPNAAESGSWGFEDLEEAPEFGSLIPDIDGSVASPLWGTTQDKTVKEKNHAYGTHGYIIEQANAECTEGNIPDKYINLVYEITKRCDSEYGNGGNDDEHCRAFHGKGNYIANITFLWKFSRLIKQKHSDYDDKKATKKEEFIDEMAESAYKEVKKPSDQTDKNILKELRERASEFVIKYYKTTSSVGEPPKNKTQTWNGRCRYIIYGMVMHSIGDVYAHTVMFKKNAADKLKEKATLTKAQQKKYLDYSYLKTLNITNNEINNIIKAVSGENTEYSDGIPMYIIKKFINGDSKRKKVHKKYADNPEFYDERVEEAILAAWYFIEGYDLVLYSIDEYAYEAAECLEPASYKLYKFNAYKKELDI